MEKLMLVFFGALGIVLLVLGSIILGSFNNINKDAIDQKDEDNLSRSATGVIVIGIIFTLFSGFGIYRLYVKSRPAIPAAIPSIPAAIPQQAFKRYYF